MKSPLQPPLIYLVSPGKLGPDSGHDDLEDLLSLIDLAVEVGIPLIQIREKQLSTSKLLSLVARAVELTRGSQTKLLVNERADIAIEAGADGVHTPSYGLPLKETKSILSSIKLIGVSTHSIADVLAAKEMGADFAVFGPVFSTPDKGAPKGLDKLCVACHNSGDMPVLGIGGINETNAAEIFECGAAGFAAIRALNSRETLIRLAEEFLS